MEPSHALSDAILTFTGIVVFFRYLNPLSQQERLLWSTFILSVTAAALFGCIRFLGYAPAKTISEFFQHFAGTAGAICLLLATHFSRKSLSLKPSYFVGLLGVVVLVFLWAHFGQQQAILKGTSVIVIPVSLGIGLEGLQRTKQRKYAWLILAIFILILATFSEKIAKIVELDAINCYHYLVALSLLCLGKAAKKEL